MGWKGIRSKTVHGLVCQSSGIKVADTLVYTGQALIVGVKVMTDKTNDASLLIYDNTSASGDPVDEWDVAGAEYYGGSMFQYPLGMSTGIYCDVTGTGASFVIFYVPLS